MAELRYHPLIDDWVMIASHRQERPQMPKDWCPFCPGSGKVPDGGYDVLRYPNDFPALSVSPPAPDPVATALFQTAPAYGRCEVVLYSPEHRALLRDMTDRHMGRLANLWLEVFNDMAADPKIEYVFVFENRGDAVGVTMPHPHGQVYGYPYIPKKIQLELDADLRHRAQTGRCLFCDILAEERRAATRIVFENEYFTAYLPFYCEYPYGLYIMSREHIRDLRGLSPQALQTLGTTVRDAVGTLDNLFGNEFPYMMCMHNGPVDGSGRDFHFHIEFFPPMRAETKQKFNASSETGAWAHCNPTCPEEKAEELRRAYSAYKKQR